MVELEAWREKFAAAGVKVAGMTYDSLDVLDTFHLEQQLQYPLLQDQAAKHVNAYGVRNEEYAPGHSAYGIPHPGILYVSPDGEVRAKYAVPGYKKRPPFEQLYADIQRLTE